MTQPFSFQESRENLRRRGELLDQMHPWTIFTRPLFAVRGMREVNRLAREFKARAKAAGWEGY